MKVNNNVNRIQHLLLILSCLLSVIYASACGPRLIPSSVEEITPTSAGEITPTKADLVKSLVDLRDAMLNKIDSDVEVTAIAFTDVKAYWKTKRWADILKLPLGIIEDTIGILKKASDWPSISGEADKLLDSSEANWQIASLMMMLQGLKEMGGKLQLAIDGPAYASAIQSMLNAADATYVPPLDKNWRQYYQKVFENCLYGVDENKPLVIPRKSTMVGRKNIGFASGALEVSSTIAREFNDLIAEIENRELPQNFPVTKIINQVKSLEMQVIKSQSWSADDITYETYLLNQGKYVLQKVETSLGSVGGRYSFFGQTAANLDKKLEIEATVEVSKAFQAAGDVMLIYSVTYKTGGATDKIEVVQKAIVVEELSLKTFSKVFYPNTEEEYYTLPQEMLFALPTELSNLWMIADDTDQYLRYLLHVSPALIVTPSPTPTPAPVSTRTAAPTKTPNTLYVDDDLRDYPNADFTKIGQALNAASAGNTIIVYPGKYTENLDVSKGQLTIKSESGADSAIVQALNSNDHVFEIKAADVKICGLTIRGATGGDKAGIYSYDRSLSVSDLILSNNNYGIYVYSTPKSPLQVSKSTFSGNNRGIYSQSSYASRYGEIHVSDSTFSDNKYGIYTSDFCGVDVSKSVFSNNDYGIYGYDRMSIHVEYSTFSNNTYGIYGDSTWGINSLHSKFDNNDYGVYAVNGWDNTLSISYSDLRSNRWGIYYNASTQSSHSIFLNNFIGNTSDVDSSPSKYVWNSTEQMTYTYNGKTYTRYLGNYWSRHTGSDTDGDGIANTPYGVINVGKDNYPLMGKWEDGAIK